MTTLTITVGRRDQLDDRTRGRIQQAERGAPIEDASPVLNFESYEELSRLFSPTNLELLEAVARNDPDSIRDAASLVDRDYKQVYRNLHELADLDVVAFDGGGPGRSKKPLLAYDALEIDVSLTDDGEADAVAP